MSAQGKAHRPTPLPEERAAPRARERRLRPRVPLLHEVVVTRAGERFTCLARDVSSVGVGMLCPEPGYAVARVGLELALGPERLVLAGVQVREERRERGFVWGVRFQDPPPHATARLVMHVRDELLKANRVAVRGRASGRSRS